MLTATSFKPGERPTGRAKGTRNKTTILKESIGLASWEQLEGYLNTEGVSKLIQALECLEGLQYIKAYVSLMEYFKPKLSRHGQSLEGLPEGSKIEITLNLSEEK
jgi:hypothetical protein